MMSCPEYKVCCCESAPILSRPWFKKFGFDIDFLFEKIKKCEELLNQHSDYQALLDEITDELRPHFSSLSKKYRALFEKMKKETPKVYALLFESDSSSFSSV
jgi:hypothetical protein